MTSLAQWFKTSRGQTTITQLFKSAEIWAKANQRSCPVPSTFWSRGKASLEAWLPSISRRSSSSVCSGGSSSWFLSESSTCSNHPWGERSRLLIWMNSSTYWRTFSTSRTTSYSRRRGRPGLSKDSSFVWTTVSTCWLYKRIDWRESNSWSLSQSSNRIAFHSSWCWQLTNSISWKQPIILAVSWRISMLSNLTTVRRNSSSTNS